MRFYFISVRLSIIKKTNYQEKGKEEALFTASGNVKPCGSNGIRIVVSQKRQNEKKGKKLKNTAICSDPGI